MSSCSRMPKDDRRGEFTGGQLREYLRRPSKRFRLTELYGARPTCGMGGGTV